MHDGERPHHPLVLDRLGAEFGRPASGTGVAPVEVASPALDALVGPQVGLPAELEIVDQRDLALGVGFGHWAVSVLRSTGREPS